MSKLVRFILDVELWVVELLIKKDGKFGLLLEILIWLMFIVFVRVLLVDVGIFVVMYCFYL